MIKQYVESEITRLEQLQAQQQQQIEALHAERIAVLGGIQAYRDVLEEMAKIEQAEAERKAAEQAELLASLFDGEQNANEN